MKYEGAKLKVKILLEGISKKEAMKSFEYWRLRIYTLTGKESEKAKIMRALWAYVIDNNLLNKLPTDPLDADDFLWEKWKDNKVEYEKYYNDYRILSIDWR